MANVEAFSFEEPDAPLVPPWPVLGAGLELVLVGWLWSLALGEAGLYARLLLTLIGLIAVGAALALQLPSGCTSSEDRFRSAGMLALACLGCAVAGVSLPESWGSISLLLQAFVGVAIAGAGLLVLATWMQSIYVSLFVVLHFGGILTAVVQVPPPPSQNATPQVQSEAAQTGQPPWLATQAMTRFYLPYLQLTHLNNGYHFYSPEPGPVTVLWFRVEYADGSSRWRRLPDHDEAPNGLITRRWGALATQTGQTIPAPPPGSDLWNQFVADRQRAGERDGIPPGEMPLPQQYREPSVPSRMLLASLARYVARNTPHPTDRAQAVKGVKAYRIDCHNANVEAFCKGLDPRDPTLYAAFFQGEFGPDGTIKPSSYSASFNANGEMINLSREERATLTEHVPLPPYLHDMVGPRKDGLLYWLIPIVRVPVAPGSEETRVINYVRIHAGDKGESSNP